MNKPPRIYLSSPHMGPAEFEFVREAFSTNWIAPLGPHVDGFESEFCALLQEQTGCGRLSAKVDAGSPSNGMLVKSGNGQRFTDSGSQAIHAAALSSGTAALHLALKLVGLRPGEEVFCSSLTFSASANPIVYEGGKPVFIDSERQSWNLDPARLEEALENRAKKGQLPRTVILVHLYGQCADIDAVAGLCQKYGVALIEDAAEALGAIYYSDAHSSVSRKPSSANAGGNVTAETNSGQQMQNSEMAHHRAVAPGTVGRLGIFSFNGNKIITTSGGGMVVSNDEALIKKARFWATQARDPAPHYQHSEIGYNYRMSNVLAGIGRGQLRVLKDRVDARRANCAIYQRAFAELPGIEFMPEARWNRCTRWLTCILVDPKRFGADRDMIRLALEAENIEARPVWKPMHLQPVFRGCEVFGGEVAEDLFCRGLCLPSGSNLSAGDLQRVVDVVKKCRR
jgi:dTDP-4-amino-4,6-dideoxygalactose transaminase